MTGIYFIALRLLFNHGRCGFSIIVLSVIGDRGKVCVYWKLCLCLCFDDLAYEYLKSMKGQIVLLLCINVEHNIRFNLVSLVPWRLHFVDSVLEAISNTLVLFSFSPWYCLEASCRLDYFAQTIRPNIILQFVLEFYFNRCYTY